MVADNYLHENTWNTSGIATATVSGHRLATEGPSAQSGGTPVRRLTRFDLEVEAPVRPRRPQGVEGQTPSRSGTQADRTAMRQVGSVVVEGTATARLCQCVMDLAANRQANSQTVWCDVRSVRRLACVTSDGLELPETRTPCSRTQRTGHRRLANAGLAADKKTREKAVGPSFSWMKVASCCNRPFAVRGDHEAKPPFTIAGTAEIVCRLSRRLAFRRNGFGWDCTSTCPTTTSPRMTPALSWRCTSAEGCGKNIRPGAPESMLIRGSL